MDNPLKLLQDKLRKDMNNYADVLANGSCRSFEEYREMCGLLKGLGIAEEHLLEIVERLRKAEDE